METTSATAVEYNRQLMVEDAVLKGLTTSDKWATRARVSDMSVIRFKRGDRLTDTTIAKLARPLGGVEKYIVRKSEAA